jgi:hypothetical protein
MHVCLLSSDPFQPYSSDEDNLGVAMEWVDDRDLGIDSWDR